MEKGVDSLEPIPGKIDGGKTEAPKRDAVAQKHKGEESLPRKTILIVDDVLVMRLRLRAQLEESGFNVLEAENGEKALALLEMNPDVQIILTDVNMPGMDGLEFTRRIRKSPTLSAIPVIICTAKGEFSTVRQAQQLGIQGFLVKPVTKPSLLAVIKRELE